MTKWMRRLRGAIGTGVVWGAAWFGAGMLMLLTLLLTTGSTGADVPYPLAFGALGFMAGVAFSLVLGFAERRRRFEEMSMRRFAAWGTTGGLALATVFVSAVSLLDDPAFLQNILVLGPVFALAGAGSATGTLALARRAHDRALQPGDGDIRRLEGTE